MPEIVDELPSGAKRSGVAAWWKAPALEMARDNPGEWVRCDGHHHPSTPHKWRNPRPVAVGVPDGFEVKGRSKGAPAGRVFVYVRWTGDTDG